MRVKRYVIAGLLSFAALLLVNQGPGTASSEPIALLPSPTVQAPAPVAAPPEPSLTPGSQCVILNRVLPTPIPGPVRTIIVTQERVRVVRVPEVRERVLVVTTPVPGPTKTVYTETFSPGQTKIIQGKIRSAVIRTSILAVTIAILIGLISLVIVYFYGYRLGETNDAKRIRNVLKRS